MRGFIRTAGSTAGSGGRPRLGVLASRRMGRAVERNRARRRLRAALGRKRGLEGVDLMVLAKREALTAPFAALELEAEKLLRWAATVGRAT